MGFKAAKNNKDRRLTRCKYVKKSKHKLYEPSPALQAIRADARPAIFAPGQEATR